MILRAMRAELQTFFSWDGTKTRSYSSLYLDILRKVFLNQFIEPMSRFTLLSLPIILLTVLFQSVIPTVGQQSTRPESGGAGPASRKIVLPPEKAAPVVIPFADETPVIDGRLDDGIWSRAALFTDFYQTNPGDNIAPSRPTEVYMLYDREHIYIAFKCWDERDKIRATVARRDGVFGEDNVRVWLDTFDDQRRAYVLGFNPLGIQQDGIFTEGLQSGADYSIDIVMDSKGVIEDWGWSVEVKIPFKSLRYVAGPGKYWGFNVARNIDRFNDEFNSWMPDDRSVAGTLVKHGRITGFDELKSERTLEIVPSVTASQTTRRVPTIPLSERTPGSLDPGRFVNQPVKGDFGVTLTYTLTPNITLDAAINPDFAEVEADAPVVRANQRFPIFFEEKRPFFLEGSEVFRTPLQVFYSRTIVDPDLAAKITGKLGRNSFGVLIASDKAPGNYSENERNEIFIRPAINEFLEKNAFFGVFRLKRDVGKESSVGFLATTRLFPEQRNLLLSSDGRFKLTDRLVFLYQAVGTHSKRCFFENEFEPLLRPEQAARNSQVCGGGTFNGITVNGNQYERYRVGNGFSWGALLDYTERDRGFIVQTSGQSRFYRADAGFTRRVDIMSNEIGFRFSSAPRPEARIVRANLYNKLELLTNLKGRLSVATWSPNLSFSLKGNMSASTYAGIGREKIYEDEFGLRRMPSRPESGRFFDSPERQTTQYWFGGNINKRFNKKFAFGFNTTYVWNEFDFDFGGGRRYPRVSPAALGGSSKLDPGTGREWKGGFGIQYTPIDAWNLSFNYNKARLTRDDTGLQAFNSNIGTLRSTYQFSRFVFIRGRLDYSSLTSGVAAQVLFGWTPSPGTALYAGYNDSLGYNGYNPFSGQYEPGFQRSQRVFFVRASYLFRRSF